MYTGKTKNLGVIGYPIEHSLSPVIQNAALRNMGLDYAYIAMPVKESELGEAAKGLRALGFDGFNITIPHKVNIIKYLDGIDDIAKLIGAVNTVAIRDGKMYGYNTDHDGFMDAFRAAEFSVENKIAVVLGIGGAARAIIYGLLDAGVKKVCIGARNLAKARETAADFVKMGEIVAFDWETAEFKESLRSAEILVNTTPLGMYPEIDEMPPVDMSILPPKSLVYDVIYTPEKTKLLLEAEKYGHIVINGEHMFAGQGATALKIWSGREVDVDVMRIALHEALVNEW